MRPSLVRRGHGILILSVLLAVALMFVLMYGNFGGGGSYTQQIAKTRDTARVIAAEIKGRDLATLIAQYRADNNKLPESLADLEAPPAATRDQWGQDLTISYKDDDVVVITSIGADGQAGTEDDSVIEERIPF